MLLKQMKYFITVVECHSFTEAAEICYISQSAISQQIQLLEAELGVKLIKRENRKFSLTSAGEYFYGHSLGILNEITHIKNETIKIGTSTDKYLKIGFLKGFASDKIRTAISKFSTLYPEVSLDIINRNHEELFDLLRLGDIDLVLNDQRRNFSDEYVNYNLVTSQCFIEVSNRNSLSSLKYVTMDDLRRMPCILVASKEQEKNESEFYQNTLGFSGNFLFAENLEEGRLMVVGNKGFMPIEEVTDTIKENLGTKCIPLYRNNQQIMRNYCAFWKKQRTNYYIEKFAYTLHEVFKKEHHK